MILISHRGNIDGPNEVRENSPYYIMETITMGFDVEIDVWYIDNQFWLGHDNPQYKIVHEFLMNKNLWCHAKNLEALIEMKKHPIHYFWHENDTVTITSKNYIWSHSRNKPIDGTISCMPELLNVDISKCAGVCSDYIIKY